MTILSASSQNNAPIYLDEKKPIEERVEDALGEYPGNKKQLEASKNESDTIDVTYNEGIYVGYRWFDKEKIEPLFAFGHGLSYTRFDYGKITADKKEMKTNHKISFTIPIKNVGNREVQLYISDPKSSLPRPIKELKAFHKVYLKPGEEKNVILTIDKSALSYFDADKHDWVAESVEFEAIIGASATDLKSSVKFKFK